MDEMSNDAKRMPELQHAMGAVATSQADTYKVLNAVEGNPGGGRY